MTSTGSPGDQRGGVSRDRAGRSGDREPPGDFVSAWGSRSDTKATAPSPNATGLKRTRAAATPSVKGCSWLRACSGRRAEAAYEEVRLVPLFNRDALVCSRGGPAGTFQRGAAASRTWFRSIVNRSSVCSRSLWSALVLSEALGGAVEVCLAVEGLRGTLVPRGRLRGRAQPSSGRGSERRGSDGFRAQLFRRECVEQGGPESREVPVVALAGLLSFVVCRAIGAPS